MNKLPKIISFSGRKHSGKTELAKVCIKYDYELINFADSLKEIICNSLDISKEYLEKYKDTITDKKYDLSKKIRYISNEINIEEKIVSEFLSKPFDSIRKILQEIGTNLIRNYNHSWHINKIKEKILNNPDKYYCIGDCRFLDEKKILEELGCECWFIIRPNMFEISNHCSEINLKWKDFGDNIIINNTNKQILIEKWQNYLQNLKFDKLSKKVLNTSSKKELRNILINLLKKYSPNEISIHFNCNVYWWCNNLMIHINKEKYNYDINTFLEATKESSYVMGLLTANGNIEQNNHNCSINLENTNKYLVEMYKKVLKSDRPIHVTKLTDKTQVYSFNCNNPYIIENMKLWNLKTDIPFLLQNNIEMLKYWIVGLIDGCGSISSNQISLFASKQIIDFLHIILPYAEKKYKHKDYETLYELNFYNQYAINFSKWLGNAFLALRRKNKSIKKNLKKKNI